MNTASQSFVKLANDNMAAFSRFLQSPEIVDLNRANIEMCTQVALESVSRVARSNALAEFTRLLGENYARYLNDYTRSMLDVMSQSQALFSRQMEEASQYVEQGMKSTVSAAENAASTMGREGREFSRNAGQMASRAVNQGGAILGEMTRTAQNAGQEMGRNAQEAGDTMMRGAREAGEEMTRDIGNAAEQTGQDMQDAGQDMARSTGNAAQRAGSAVEDSVREGVDASMDAAQTDREQEDRRSRSEVIDFEDRRKNAQDAKGQQAQNTQAKGTQGGKGQEGQRNEAESHAPQGKRARGGRG